MIRSKIYIILILFIWLANYIQAQEANYRKIDKYAFQTPESLSKSFAELSGYLIKITRNDFEKARAIYTWIALHIKYDKERYNKNDLSFYAKINLAEDALLYRQSICSGYAQLFQALAEYAGLECEFIEGYARRPHDIGTSFSKINHAWNAVKIENKWYLLDVTWGAVDSVKTLNALYAKPEFEFYFLTDPKKFVFTHFPKDPQWLLLPKPIDKQTFENLPFLFPAFENLALDSLLTQTGIIRTDGHFSVELGIKYSGFLEALVTDYKENILIQGVTIDYMRKNSNLNIEVYLERKGAFLLQVFYETNLILIYKIFSE